MAREVTCEIIEELGVIHEAQTQDMNIQVNKLSWNGATPVIDIRWWNLKGDDPKPLKGIGLTEDAANQLATILIDLGYGESKPKEKKEKKKVAEEATSTKKKKKTTK